MALYLLAGLAVLAAIPIAVKWSAKRDDPVSRLAREKREAKDAVALAAKQDLACEAIEIREPGGELWAHGCGRRARYVPSGSGYRIEGKPEPDEADACTTRWARDEGDPREAASRILAAGKPVRVRVPVTAFGVQGLAKLRYGENVEVFVEVDASAVPEAIHVPCIDPAADGGVREGRCTKEWAAASEIAECR